MATGSASVVSKALLQAKKAQADEDAVTLAITGRYVGGTGRPVPRAVAPAPWHPRCGTRAVACMHPPTSAIVVR